MEKNKELIITHRETRIKEGEDWRGLQTTKLKNLG